MHNIIHTAKDLVTFSNCTDGDVRLIGGRVDYEGRVEICNNNAWGTVCLGASRSTIYTWDTTDARVVCRQLGHQEFGELLLICQEMLDYYILNYKHLSVCE